MFESASPDTRRRLVGLLMAPLGILSLVAVSDGVFANIRLRGGLSNAPMMIEALEQVRSREVAELAQHSEQVQLGVLDQLIPMLSAPSLRASSAAAVLLLQILEQRPTQGQVN